MQFRKNSFTYSRFFACIQPNTNACRSQQVHACNFLLRTHKNNAVISNIIKSMVLKWSAPDTVIAEKGHATDAVKWEIRHAAYWGLFHAPGRGVLPVVNTGCPPASYGIFYFRFPFGTCVVRSKPRTVKCVDIYGLMFIDILIVMYRVYNLIFSVPITKASDNSPKSNKVSDRAPCSTSVPPACIFKRKTRRQIWNTWCPKDQRCWYYLNLKKKCCFVWVWKLISHFKKRTFS
jgi:hypothetical protein